MGLCEIDKVQSTPATLVLRNLETGARTRILHTNIQCYTVEKEHGLVTIEMKNGTTHVVKNINHKGS